MDIALKIIGVLIFTFLFSSLSFGICSLIIPALGVSYAQSLVITFIVVVGITVFGEIIEYIDGGNDEE